MIALFVVWILCGVFAAMIASGKGQGGCSWFIGGFLFGPLALLATLGLRDKKNDLNTSRLVANQEQLLNEIQRKHDWERRQWEQEKQYRNEENFDNDLKQLPPEQEEWDEGETFEHELEDENDLNNYLHTLEYDEDVPGLLEQINSLGIETREDFLERLKWSCEEKDENESLCLFAEYFWKDVLNKEEDNDYLKYWEEELTKSFIAIRTQDNAYFLKRRYEK